MKNKKTVVALGLMSLLSAIPTSHAIAAGDHNGFSSADNQITSSDWAHLDGVQNLSGDSVFEVAYDPAQGNIGCANIGCDDLLMV
jgi:hypothetical protein